MFDFALKRPVIAPALAAALLVATLDPAIVSASIPPPPNQQPFDEIRLRNGGLVRGEVTDMAPGSYVVVDSRNKSRRFDWNDVDAVVLRDGTVHGRDAIPVPFVKPDPKPDLGPDPKPDPKPDTGPDIGPDPKPEPEPDLEPKPDPGPKFDPDDLGPESTDPAVGPGAGPTVAINVNDKGSPVELHSGDGTVVCTSPCGIALPSGDGEFFATIDGKRVGKPFRFDGSTDYTVKVSRKDPIKLWSGVALIPAAVIIGVGIGIIPALHNIPRSQVAGYAAGGAAIGVLGIAGGVTLIMFSRSKVKVLPGIQ